MANHKQLTGMRWCLVDAFLLWLMVPGGTAQETAEATAIYGTVVDGLAVIRSQMVW